MTTPDDLRYWPPLLADIARTLGVAAALRLVARYGGRRIHIPKRADHGTLAQELGDDLAQFLVERHRGEAARLSVPTLGVRLALERRRYVLTHGHQSANDIAAAIGITARRVEKIRSEARHDPRNDLRQMTLFEGSP